MYNIKINIELDIKLVAILNDKHVPSTHIILQCSIIRVHSLTNVQLQMVLQSLKLWVTGTSKSSSGHKTQNKYCINYFLVMLIAIGRASMSEREKGRRALHARVESRLTIYGLKHSKYTPPDGFPRTLRAQRVFMQFSINFRISSKAELSKAVFAGAQRRPLWLHSP